MSLTIPPDLAARVTRSPRVAGEMATVVREIAALADQTVPVRTGTLRDSQVSDVQIGPNGPVGLIGYEAFYAHIVHNGSVKLVANPWLLNAALAILRRKASSAAA